MGRYSSSWQCFFSLSVASQVFIIVFFSGVSMSSQERDPAAMLFG